MKCILRGLENLESVFVKPLRILEVDASISLREIREITSILQPFAAIWVVFLFHFYDIP